MKVPINKKAPTSGDEWNTLHERFPIPFQNPSLLREAFTHSSYANEHRDAIANERIEFLGDAVLQLAVSHHLYAKYPDWPEGQLTFVRSAIVREKALYELAKQLHLGDYLLLGRGELLSGGRERPSLLANAMEALVGAIYLDAGWDAVNVFLTEHMFPMIDAYVARGVIDAKSRLHQYVQQHGFGMIDYEVVEEHGPANDREFVVRVLIQGVVYGIGRGRSKKVAEQHAAEATLAQL